MDTLEDDQASSSHLRKRDFARHDGHTCPPVECRFIEHVVPQGPTHPSHTPLAPTDTMSAAVAAPDPAPVGTPPVLPAIAPAGPPPGPPTPDNGSVGARRGIETRSASSAEGPYANVRNTLGSALKNRRRLLIAIASIALVLLLMSLGIFAALTWDFIEYRRYKFIKRL